MHIPQDFRYAVRGLRRSRVFTATVMITLGLGIGVNAAMFGAVDRLMFRPFAMLRDPGAVHRVYLQFGRDQRFTSSLYQYARYLDLERWTSSFSQYAAVSAWQLAVGPSDVGRERQTAGVSASFFGFFTARPALGRFFDASEDSVPMGADVVVISYDYWQSSMAGRNVLGEKLQVGPRLLTIIGVAPKGFVGVTEGEPPVVFVPVTTFAYMLNQGNAQSFARSYHWDWMSMLVRRKPGVTVAAASADLTKAYVRSWDAQRLLDSWLPPSASRKPRAVAGAVRRAGGPDAGLESRTLLWVGGVAVIVLLIACANVANLMVARVLRRRREIAVRLALGISHRRLATQFLVESTLLSTLGCLTGIVVALWVAAALQRLVVHEGALLDWETLLIAVAFAGAAGILTSIGPALLAVRGDLSSVLRAGMREAHYQRSRTRSTLLVAQGALSVILLVGAGLFVRSLDNVRSQRLGWEPDPVLIVTPNYRGLVMDSATVTAFRARLLGAAQSLPGVAFAARVNGLPFGTSTFSLFVRGIDSVQRLGRFNYQATTPDYFSVVQTHILRGRGFTPSERGSLGRVAVVSESMGRRLWPGKDALGQCFRLEADTMPCTTVIGIAEDAVQYSISDNERLVYYMPDEAPPSMRPGNRLLLRMTGDAPAQMEQVRRALQAVMPAPAYVTVSTLEDLVDRQRRSWRLGAEAFSAFGVLALLVAAVGLYAVIAHDVEQRTHEMGVRVALGAQVWNIVRLIVAQAMTFAAAGVTLGLVTALLLSRWLQPLLFQESSRDPAVFGVVALTLGLVAFVASAAPALRASRADPSTALRSE
ncbi:MAG TPA: ADOP family duplicated permease [Gemmatimonadaceae bacterium]|jgi:predicted permease